MENVEIDLNRLDRFDRCAAPIASVFFATISSTEGIARSHPARASVSKADPIRKKEMNADILQKTTPSAEFVYCCLDDFSRRRYLIKRRSIKTSVVNGHAEIKTMMMKAMASKKNSRCISR